MIDYQPCKTHLLRERGISEGCCAEASGVNLSLHARIEVENREKKLTTIISRLGIRAYPYMRPFVPKICRTYIRKKYASRIYKKFNDVWPIDVNAVHPPAGWKGWPDGKRFAFNLTHDVEITRGLDRCHALADIEKQYGFQSSFNFVAEDYDTPPKLREFLIENGFEVGVHGLSHRGNMFRSKRLFLNQVPAINRYLRDWRAVGFRAPCMYHNLDWIHDLEIDYDASTFDTDPFEPQPDPAGTIFPFWIDGGSARRGYVELPYTLPQDSTCFILLQAKDIEIWKMKLDWIVDQGGMALLNTHPDYIRFDGKRPAFDEYPVEYYQQFLDYVRTKYDGQYWHVLPRELARFYRDNYATLDHKS
jgi:peptidoglycan/xylan/chitin deacetylase (PgdA/CDA1 family)